MLAGLLEARDRLTTNLKTFRFYNADIAEAEDEKKSQKSDDGALKFERVQQEHSGWCGIAWADVMPKGGLCKATEFYQAAVFAVVKSNLARALYMVTVKLMLYRSFRLMRDNMAGEGHHNSLDPACREEEARTSAFLSNLTQATITNARGYPWKQLSVK